MTIGLFDDIDPGASAADFYGLRESGDVVSHTASYSRLLHATLAYHAARAAWRQQDAMPYGRALTIAKAVAAMHSAIVSAFWPRAPPPRPRRDAPAA